MRIRDLGVHFEHIRVEIHGGSCTATSGSLVEVDILELSESPLAFSTPTWDWVKDGDEIRPETDTQNG